MIDDVDPEYKGPVKPRFRERFTGWQVGVAVSFILVVLVLLLHISILIWIYASLNPHNGIALAHEGNCSQIEKWSQWIHLLINLLSTLMLGASNYCMQRLSSPTRNDLDRAHAARRWLDIGVPSVRNLRSLDRRRVALWLIIGLSSAPLHLL